MNARDIIGKYIPIKCVRCAADIPTRLWYVTATAKDNTGKRRRVVASGEWQPMKWLAGALTETGHKHVNLTDRKPRPENNPGAVYWLLVGKE